MADYHPDDPAEAMLADLSGHVSDLKRVLADIEAKASTNVASHVLRALPHSIDKAVAIVSGAVLVVIAASGFGLGWWMHGDAPTVYGIKAGTEQCSTTPSGRLCWQPYLVPTPKPNPALFRS
jgi:hypothetical protein